MKQKIRSIRYAGGYRYNIRFTDDRSGTVDFKPFLWGEVFEKVKDRDFFRQASIDKTAGTITWPNGVDIAPETLYQELVNPR